MRRLRSRRTHIKCLITPIIVSDFFSNYMCTVMHLLEGARTVYAIIRVSLSKSGLIDVNCAVKLHKLWNLLVCVDLLYMLIYRF